MIKHIFRISSALTLITVGIAGIFLPLIPGLLLIFLGAALMLDKNPRVLFKEVTAKAKYEKKRV